MVFLNNAERQIDVVTPSESVEEMRLKLNSILRRVQENLLTLEGRGGTITLKDSLLVEGSIDAEPVFWEVGASADEASTGYVTFDYPWQILDDENFEMSPDNIAVFVKRDGTYLVQAQVMGEASAGGALEYKLYVNSSVVALKTLAALGAGAVISVGLQATVTLTSRDRIYLEMSVGASRVGGSFRESVLSITKLN